MRILNLLSSGGVGGIETLCKAIGEKRKEMHTFCFLFEGGPICEEMKAEGLNIIELQNIGSNFSFAKFSALKKIAVKYDIIAVHHGTFSLQLYFVLLKRQNLKAKFVLTIHSCFEEKVYYFKNPIKTFLRKQVLIDAIKLSDKIIYVSEAGRNSFLNCFKINKEKTSVVYNGISSQIIENAEKNIPIFQNTLNILYIGRLAEVKGVDLLIKAAKILKGKIPFQIMVVGDGQEKKKLQNLAKELKLEDFILFKGMQRDTDSYYSWANVFVYPSVWQEVFGISIVEAMAYGLPCIANNVGGIPEIICNEENGFLTKKANEKEIAETILKVFEKYKSQTIKKIQINAKNTAKQFTIDRTVYQLNFIYHSLL